MVGRSVHEHYRRDLNLLSRDDYKRSLVGYSGIQVRVIVAFATRKYHSTVTRQGKSGYEETYEERPPV